MTEEKISCLMVTMPKRLALFRQSVAAYCEQTYENKELVVVTDGPRDGMRPLAAHVESLGRSDVRVVHEERSRSLGALRNLSCEAASGAYFCQWDDDDIYHPRRLEEQYRALKQQDAACLYLEETMQFMVESRRLYWLNWHATQQRAHPGTLLCSRSAMIAYPEEGEAAEYTHDSVVCLELQKRLGFATLAAQPFLYVYVTHDLNKYPREHHEMLAEQLAISKGLLQRRERELREGLAPIDFGAGDVTVQGSNGQAFVLSAKRSS
jgi:glycosyltransferase involved in cell wall biosynthesis